MRTRIIVGHVVFLLFGGSVSIAQDSDETKDVASEFPSGEVEYEMRIGAVDFSCGLEFQYSDTFDLEPLVLDATIEFGSAEDLGETLTKDPSDFVALKVTTGTEWLGVLSKKDQSVAFDSKSFFDATETEIKDRYGDVVTASVFKVDKVSGEYIRGTIDGKISARRYLSNWLGDAFECEGESTLLMLPK